MEQGRGPLSAPPSLSLSPHPALHLYLPLLPSTWAVTASVNRWHQPHIALSSQCLAFTWLASVPHEILVGALIRPPTTFTGTLSFFSTAVRSGEELDSGAIKDKASKINYLDKLVALVGICSGHSIDVRPSKVVAGLEPEGTNALLTVGETEREREKRAEAIALVTEHRCMSLPITFSSNATPPPRSCQALGKCAKSQDLDFDEAVRRALSGESPGQNPPPLRESGSVATGGSDSRGGNDSRGDQGGGGGGGGDVQEAKAEEKVQGGGGGGGGGGRRGSGEEGVGSRRASAGASSGGADEKVRAEAVGMPAGLPMCAWCMASRQVFQALLVLTLCT